MRSFVFHRLTAILICQQAGFALEEIRSMFEPPAGERAIIAESKLTQLDGKIERLKQAQGWVRGILARGCASLDGCDIVEYLDPRTLG